jgi:orotate phosphoribosyltransferase
MVSDKKLFERNAERIWQVGAYSEDFEKPRIYVSGKIGPPYVNCAKFQNRPEQWEGAVKDFVAKIKNNFKSHYIKEIDRIVGGEVRDLVFSIPVANKLGKKHTIIRKGETTHGLGGNLVTEILPNEEVFLISDLLTSGKSAKQWISAIYDAGGIIWNYFNFFDRLQGGEEAIEIFMESKYDQPISGTSVVQMNEKFFEIGIDSGFTTEKKYENLQKYLENPDKWAIEYLFSHPEFLADNIKGGERGKILNTYPVIKEDEKFMRRVRKLASKGLDF